MKNNSIGKEILAIIPARAGSKSIKNKNIKNFCGQPLISWAINHALKSKVDRVLVNTDSEQIKKIAKFYGAEVPFLRSKKLSTSKMAIEPVLKDCLIKLKKKFNYVPKYLVLLMPTSPFRTSKDINNVINIIKKNQNVTSVISVDRVHANDNPSWMLKYNNKKIKLLNNKELSSMPVRRQLLAPVFKRNDFVYILKPNNLYLKKPELYGNQIRLYENKKNRFNIDINSAEDWKIAEMLFKFKI